MGQKLCKKIPNLTDMRQPLYAADMDRAKELRMKFEHVFRQILILSLIVTHSRNHFVAQITHICFGLFIRVCDDYVNNRMNIDG
jgi:hypothetical protein